MINWCLQQPREGKPLTLDDAKMIALVEAGAGRDRRFVRKPALRTPARKGGIARSKRQQAQR